MDKNYEFKNTILKVENISLSLGGTPILRDVNIDIRDVVRPGMSQGQIVGFLGPSGVGKTKLFEILAGLLQPDTGQVLIGDPLTPVEVGRVGVVQQSYPLFNHRTVIGNLLVAADRKGIPAGERKEKCLEMLEHFGLEGFANRFPAELSGGQRQRVAIAQQLLCSDHFLLLDEPFSGLDILMIERVCDLLRKISTLHEQNTIIIVSHDIESTASIADTLWIMGRDQDDQGNFIPGSRIKHTINLMDRGLAWQENVMSRRDFHELVDEVRGLFKSL
jgi:polar amino acid transport system ATP-binding protein/sulfate transport system ATP-binding protein